MTHETYESLEEIRRIKEKCSLARLARTPEEQRLHSEKVVRMAEEAMGRSIKVAGHPKRSRVAEEEPAQV
jgi:hypothetical protein